MHSAQAFQIKLLKESFSSTLSIVSDSPILNHLQLLLSLTPQIMLLCLYASMLINQWVLLAIGWPEDQSSQWNPLVKCLNLTVEYSTVILSVFID